MIINHDIETVRECSVMTPNKNCLNYLWED